MYCNEPIGGIYSDPPAPRTCDGVGCNNRVRSTDESAWPLLCWECQRDGNEIEGSDEWPQDSDVPAESEEN